MRLKRKAGIIPVNYKAKARKRRECGWGNSVKPGKMESSSIRV
jgi:hypothetical protein